MRPLVNQVIDIDLESKLTVWAIRSTVLFVCSCFVIWNTWPIFDQYATKSTMLTSSEEKSPSDKLPVPLIVFCNESAYTNTSMFTSIQEYLSHTQDPKAFLLGAGASKANTTDHDWNFEYLYTLYRGQCMALKYKHELGSQVINEWYVYLNRSFSLRVIILEDEETFYLFHELWERHGMKEAINVPAGSLYTEIVLKRKVYVDLTVDDCNSDSDYHRGGLVLYIYRSSKNNDNFF